MAGWGGGAPSRGVFIMFDKAVNYGQILKYVDSSPRSVSLSGKFKIPNNQTHFTLVVGGWGVPSTNFSFFHCFDQIYQRV